MTSAELATRYYCYAAQCWFLAKRQDCADDKLTLTDMARTWLDLADSVKRNESRLAPGTERYH